MKKPFLLGISFLTACIGGAAYYANKNEPPMFEDKEENSYQHAPAFHKWIRGLVSFITTVYGEEDDFARQLKIATLNKEDESLPDIFLQEVETTPPCDSRNSSIKYIYAKGFLIFVMQKETGNVYIHKSLFPSLARLLFNVDIPTQVLQDPAGLTDAHELELQYGAATTTTKYLVPLTELFYDVSAYKRLTREYIDFLSSMYVE